MKQELFAAAERKNLLTKRECGRALARTTWLSVISTDKITRDFMEFLQIFKRFSGETML